MILSTLVKLHGDIGSLVAEQNPHHHELKEAALLVRSTITRFCTYQEAVYGGLATAG